MAKSVDPHSVFLNGESVQLENLTFFVELAVTKRNRLGSSASDKPLKINFLGLNEDGVYTTDWTENKENFGIKSINFKMTSSYVPQVDIVFEDVRGQALFNNFTSSKYKVLFDMPPPIFDLTLKGYYGQAVTYRLHLIKQSVAFVNNNSYEISASFVGMTFAPLADMYVDYLEVASYLNNENNENNISYLDLTQKSQQLSSKIKNVTSDDVKYINNIGEKNNDLNSIKDNYISKFIEDINSISTSEVNSLFRVDLDSVKKNVVNISYKYIPTNSIGDRFPNRDVYDNLLMGIDEKKKFFNENKLKYKILKDVVTYDVLNKINVDFKTPTYVIIFSIDLSTIDLEIHKAINSNIKIIQDKTLKLREKVNQVTSEIFGEGPHLRQILKIIIDDAKKFFISLKSVVQEAESSRSDKKSKTPNSEAPMYAFPNYYINKSINGKTTQVLTIPNEPTWPEVKFINKYINAKMEVKSFKDSFKENNFDFENNGENKYVPINSFDSSLDDNGNWNEDKNVDNIINRVIKRAMLITNSKSDINTIPELDTKILNLYSKLDARNLINVLKTKEKLFDAFLLKVNTESFKFQNYNINDTTEISGASSKISYKIGLNYKIKSKEEFPSGSPILKTNTEIDDSLVKELNDNLIKNFTTNNYAPFQEDNGYLCQYNIRFYSDMSFKNGFVNKSDFYGNFRWSSSLVKIFTNDNPDIFYFSQKNDRLSDVTNANEFLDKLFLNLGRETNINYHILSPFMLVNFRDSSGISEIPKFVLITWGYILSILNTTTIDFIIDEKQNWLNLPIDLKNDLLKFYNDFVYFFNNNTHQSSEFKIQLRSIEDDENENIDELKNSFYHNFFMTDFCELYYIFYGDYMVFNPDKKIPLYTNKNKNYDKYLNTFKSELIRLKTDIKKEITDFKGDIKSKINNTDIKTELYYNFKSFIDKWMLNTPENIDPFSNGGGMFNIDKFLTVDRSFTDIGDQVLVDLSPIYSIETTSDTNLYTLLLNFLSKNNFEFFALPSYVDYNNSGLLWNNSNINKVFGTNPTANFNIEPRFICMYVGGTSSQLDINLGMGNSHEDDSDKFDVIPDLIDGGVQAFKVDFGTNTQSFFHGLKLDQLEFKETNESIKILDQIANSDPNVTKIATNSLYNVYQQRSYTATLEMMGNVMIQPTMYFDLVNVAMFKGTYLILEVNHQITANNFTSSFKGVRIPKIPKPYVTDPIIFTNIDGLDPALLNINSSTTNYAGNAKITSRDLKEVKEALNSLGGIKNSILNSQEKALLDVISYAEGTLGYGSFNGYDVLNGFKLIPSWKPDYKMGHQWGIRAAGKYQFQGPTWLSYSIGTDSIDGGKNKAFSADNQDITCLKTINIRLKPRRLSILNITETNFVEYTDALALEWASFPYYMAKMKEDPRSDKFKGGNKSWTPGQGFYKGQGGKHSKEELWLVYSISLKKYQGNPMSEADLNNLVAKINDKVGDSNGSGSIRRLIARYGKLDVLHTDMRPEDRKTDTNKAFIEKQIVKWSVPSDIKSKISVLPSNVEINKDLQEPLEKALRGLIASELHTEIKTFDGCFNIRPQRSSNVVSVHAYAMAIDINASTNPFGGKTTFSPEFLQVWRSHGFTVGADFGRGREDGMHYEYTKSV